MLDAICTLEGQDAVPYNVFSFQKLTDDEIERYRQYLTCPECGGKAFYRKASSDGKAACFGSRYHQLDCREYAPSAQRTREEHDALEVAQQLVDSDALLIDFAYKPRSSSAKKRSANQATKTLASTPKGASDTDVNGTGSCDTQVTEAKANYQSASAHQDKGVDVPKPDKRVASQGLQKLLHSLLRGSDLAQSDLWVYTDSERKYRWRAKNLFVNFVDAEPIDGHKPRMYWGTISHADHSLNWLNPADSKDIGIPIEAYRDELLTRFEIEDRRDLEGAGIILFGKCFWNKDKTRKIIQLWESDLSRLFISKIEES